MTRTLNSVNLLSTPPVHSVIADVVAPGMSLNSDQGTDGTRRSGVWRRITKRVGLGQLASVAMALTGVFTTLLVNDKASQAFFQNLFAYGAIFLTFLPLHAVLGWRAASNVTSPDAPPVVWWSYLQPRHFAFWRYAIIAAFDFGANALAVWAYNYTDLMSVQLLDCATILFVMVLTRLVFQRSPGWTQVTGCLIALVGLVALVVLDSLGDSQSNNGSSPLLGDALCIGASACYAVSNVACEALVKAPSAVDDPCAGAPSLYVAVDSDGEIASVVVAPPNDDDDDATMKAALTVEATEAKAALTTFVGPRASASAAAPGWHLAVEYLAFLAPCGLVYAAIAVSICHEDVTFAVTNASSADWWYLAGFVGVMVAVYGVLPILFLVTSATFANISLLSSDVYSLVMNFAVFGIRPQPAFFVPFAIILAGVMVYQGAVDVEALVCKRCKHQRVLPAQESP